MGQPPRGGTYVNIDGACCYDGDPCTVDGWECADSECESYTCLFEPFCNDGNPCTNDVCTVGACDEPICSFPCLPDCTGCPDGVCISSGGACACQEPSATLSLNPSSISATTSWPGFPAGANESDITVTWDPPECEGTLEIVELEPDQVGGYLPAGEGTLTQDPNDPNLWHYVAFDEPPNELCPEPVKVWIAAKQGGAELTRKSILVWPVHTFLTTGANTNIPLDYAYITWKYAAVLATTGGAFTGGVTFSPNPSIQCRGVPAYACTTWNPLTGTYSVVFGTSTFTGSENQAASIIGHELLHTAVGLMAGECPAYEWERDHAQQTGIWFCDLPYLGIVVQYLSDPDHNCP